MIGFQSGGRTPQHVLVEEEKRADRHGDRAGRAPLRFLVAELIRGSSVMAGQPINGADIVGLGVRREPAKVEFIHEFLKQCSHGDRIVHRGIQQGQNTAKLGAVLTLFMA